MTSHFILIEGPVCGGRVAEKEEAMGGGCLAERDGCVCQMKNDKESEGQS